MSAYETLDMNDIRDLIIALLLCCVVYLAWALYDARSQIDRLARDNWHMVNAAVERDREHASEVNALLKKRGR